MYSFTSLLLPLALQLSITSAAPVVKRLVGTPVIPGDFPDPAIINTKNGWYAFGTTNGKNNVQLARSADFNSWAVLSQDALPTLPSWAKGPVWAPDVSQRDDGSYLMYYSAVLTASSAHHCVGVAISSNIEGPYSPMTRPLICPDPTGQGFNANAAIGSPGKGGAIDAAGFKDVDGKRYVLYKVDGNSVGSGGSCGNSNPGQTPTPIMLVQVQADGITQAGAPVQLLDRIDSDGPLIEAPNLVRSADGTYSLFFSSNCYTTPNYDVAFATAPSITGPYTRAAPLIKTGSDGLTAPGGASIAADGVHMVFHANFNKGRAMFTNTIAGNGKGIRSA